MTLQLSLNSLPRPQYLALQIEAAAILRIVQIEQPLESLCYDFHFYIAHLARPYVQD